MKAFEYFCTAQALNLHPALLEFTHPVTGNPLHICGVLPQETLCVRDGELFLDGSLVGFAKDIFHYLKVPKSDGFFPAWVGFFSYEFARFFGKKCHGQNLAFPDAYFQRFDRGLLIDNGIIVHHDKLPYVTHASIPAPRVRALTPALSADIFVDKVRAIKERIRAGDVYQVNLSLPFFFDTDKDDMLALYAAMRRYNKSPFMGIFRFEGGWLLSGSPERLFSLQNDKITARPIAGTKSRAHEDEQLEGLRTCPKENAEHAMLVDLMRNDLNMIAKPNTVTVQEDRTVEFYSHVMHLVSSVSAKIKPETRLKDIFNAVFPGGTITGAPKITVMETIAELEEHPRGPYTGSLGYISSGYGIDFNIIIRSIAALHHEARINAGAGIVIDSDENSEWHEVLRKSQAIKDILEHKSTPKPWRAPIKGPAIPNSVIKNEASNCNRVLFIENHDSFSFNIVDALRTCGAHVDIANVTGSFLLTDYSHVVIGPGPGNPERMPDLMKIIDDVTAQRLPLLGICLGHQAIGFHYGARIKKLPLPVHGKPQAIHHFAEGLFAHLQKPTTFTRYHSLVIDRAPHDFVVDAYSDDDSIMAIRHQYKPIFGVQFHPESYLSKGGLVLLGNFLGTKS